MREVLTQTTSQRESEVEEVAVFREVVTQTIS
jgi:hypothetical protein